MNLRMVHSLELIFRHIGGLDTRLWQRRSFQQIYLEAGEELGVIVRKSMLKSQTERMECECEIEPRNYQ
jgi:hypothetical protein